MNNKEEHEIFRLLKNQKVLHTQKGLHTQKATMQLLVQKYLKHLSVDEKVNILKQTDFQVFRIITEFFLSDLVSMFLFGRMVTRLLYGHQRLGRMS